MSLSRAFTTRRLKLGGHDSNNDSHGLKHQRSQTLRQKISAPVQLIHTTNMLTYNAPDLPRPKRSNSTKSEDDSASVSTTDSTPPTSPDIAPGERSSSPVPNHLSSYFKTPGKPPHRPTDSVPFAVAAPEIPKRSPSHTKQNSYDAIARSHSIARMSRDSEHSASTRGFSRVSSTSTSTRASSASHASTPRSMKQLTPPPAPVPTAAQQQATKEMHPFGPELAQVTELAEEYSSSQLELVDEDTEYIQSRGLAKFNADDYLGLIQSISANFFSDTTHIKQAAPLWI